MTLKLTVLANLDASPRMARPWTIASSIEELSEMLNRHMIATARTTPSGLELEFTPENIHTDKPIARLFARYRGNRHIQSEWFAFFTDAGQLIDDTLVERARETIKCK